MDVVNGKTGIAADCFLECREAVNRKLESLRPFSAAPTLENAFEAALFPGGKRLRPILALACGEVFGERTDALLSVAASVELLHTASLILDDLPAMDNAPQRHGRLALHLRFDSSTAILTAHSLVSLAFESVTASSLSDGCARNICRELSRTIGAWGMAAGQAMDLRGSRKADAVLETAELKTGRLFRASAVCGALAVSADASVVEACGKFGLHMGIAYQMADDLSDRHEEDKPGYSVNAVNTLGEAQAQALYAEELRKAKMALRRMPHPGPLRELFSLLEGKAHG